MNEKMARKMDDESSSGPVNYYELKELLDEFVSMRVLLMAGVPENVFIVSESSSFAVAKEREVFTFEKIKKAFPPWLLR
jgi:hypothetical protein